MASHVPPDSKPQALDGSLFQPELTNGDHATAEESAPEVKPTNADSYIENGILSTAQPDIDMKGSAQIPAADLAHSTPVTEISSGMDGIAGYIPKEVVVHSHPTPPPDQPLISSEAIIDTEMTHAGDALQPQPEPLHEPVDAPVTAPALSELSLVRPREEDDEDERASKRSRMDVDDPAHVVSTQASFSPAVESGDAVGIEASGGEFGGGNKTVNGGAVVEAASAEVSVEPSFKDVVPSAAEASPADIKMGEVSAQAAISGASSEQLPHPGVNGLSAHPGGGDAKPSAEIAISAAGPTPVVPTPVVAPTYSTEPMTSAQKQVIVGLVKNLKKTKHASAFLHPVDPVALNIPQYPEMIKNPMDITTMEEKLKTDKYSSAQEFMNDFGLIVGNCKKFNGDAHPVSLAAENMNAYVRKGMEKLPGPGQIAPPKSQKSHHKRASPAIKDPAPRREPRAAAAPVPAPATPSFALQPDGTPQIRRDSSMNQRPARAIKPPPNRELTYAKPKRKEHMLELKFSEHVLELLRSPRYSSLNSIFQVPVDPVALNIPHYRQIVKNPMDLSTMAQKLKQGQYTKANEFKKDFELMIENCLIFNTPPNPVRDLAIGLKREFAALWQGKEKWEKANKPQSHRATSQSGGEESADEDAEDEDEADDDKNAQILALQQQLAEMQNTIAGMAGVSKPAKQKRAKGGNSHKKIGAVSAVPKSRAPATKSKQKKVSKPKQVSYDEKQEISEAVGNMNEAQVGRLTQIITENCAKYRDMEEMELEIDDLPNDVQAMLLKYVRELFGNPKKGRQPSPDDLAAEDDDDFAPARGRAGSKDAKRKKHKPMGKREQTDTISKLQSKLAQFNGGATSDSGSPTSFQNPQADTSGDEESEESEEE